MGAFPDIIGSGYYRSSLYKNKTTEVGDQATVRYRSWSRPRYSFGLSWDFLDDDERLAIEAYLVTVGGPTEPFPWYDWRELSWAWVPMGVGDGTTRSFFVPGKLVSNAFFFGNYNTILPLASPATLGHANPEEGKGPHGNAQVTFETAPALDTVLSASFTGRRLFDVYFNAVQSSFVSLLEFQGYFSWAATFVESKLNG